jgi:hypothetical protein
MMPKWSEIGHDVSSVQHIVIQKHMLTFWKNANNRLGIRHWQASLWLVLLSLLLSLQTFVCHTYISIYIMHIFNIGQPPGGGQ